MSNMSYCRMQNTYNDLRDCYENWENVEEGESEEKYRQKILELAKKIVANWGEDDDED